jgi:enoyl-CoA hydratase/carnithine racemase
MATTPVGSEVVLYEVAGGVATITLNRPDRLNAWTQAMGEQYFDSLDRAAADPEVRAIVVTGAGRGFCAGADMDMLKSIGGGDAVVGSERRRFPSHTLDIPKPVIAAVNGPCAGFGLVVALMCDIRFAAAGAKFTSAFVRRGLIAEYGSAWLLPRLIGPGRALDVLLSGRVFLAEEALQMGIVNQVAPGEKLLQEAGAYARDLAENCSPWSMAQIKRQVYGDLDRDFRGALDSALELMATSLQGADFKEGVDSFLEQRPPHFRTLER